MELKEYDALLHDAEKRVDRLKALYEQYFQGIERLEPSVQRKDVERRMLDLFKLKPRNTALRFRYQSLVQRYTTLKTHWGKIARQIEEGTYRRDILRARKIREQAREERMRRSSMPPDGDVDLDVEIDLGSEVPAAGTSQPMDREIEGVLLAVSGAKPPTATKPHASPVATDSQASVTPSAEDAPSGTFERTTTTTVAANQGNKPDETGRFPRPVPAPTAASIPPTAAGTKAIAKFARPAASDPPRSVGSAEATSPLALSPKSDFPMPSVAGPVQVTPKVPSPPGKASPAVLPPQSAPRSSSDAVSAGRPDNKPPPVPGRPVPPPAPSGSKPRTNNGLERAQARTNPLAPSPGAVVPSKPAAVAAPKPLPAPPTPTPPAARAIPPQPQPIPVPPAPKRQATPGPSAKPAVQSTAKPAPTAQRPAAVGDVADDTVRRVYDQYVTARRKNNEPVDSVKLETVAKQLRDMAQKHRQKHQGKTVDFEVVVRDGRVGVKPVTK